MADTNILISALLFPSSLPAKALLHIANAHALVLCEHIISELHDVVGRKRPGLLGEIDILLASLSYELVPSSPASPMVIQDPKDQPILNAAIFADVDIIISGDKHFLRLDLNRPIVMTVAAFCALERL
jgi:putative PIN family toxin of toxin-antitoxin system